MNKYEQFEDWIAEKTNGRNLNKRNKRARYDVRSGNGTKLECKLSSEPQFNNQAKCSALLGYGRSPKVYDRLIWGIETTLHGGLVIFDIPYAWVVDFCGSHQWKTLNCGLLNSYSRTGYELWTDFHIAEEQLRILYG